MLADALVSIRLSLLTSDLPSNLEIFFFFFLLASNHDTPHVSRLNMKLSVAALLSAGAAMVAAQEPVILHARAFFVLKFPFLTAVDGKIVVDQPVDRPSCDGTSAPWTAFYFDGPELFIYTPEGKTQQVFVDATIPGTSPREKKYYGHMASTSCVDSQD